MRIHSNFTLHIGKKRNQLTHCKNIRHTKKKLIATTKNSKQGPEKNDPPCKMNVVLANRNIEIERTNVHASTVHALFQFDSEYKSKIDFGKHTQAEMELLLMEVFLLDEVSMLDDPCFASICDVMSTIDDSRQPKNKGADCFGKTHLIMFGDFKQETCFCCH